MAQTIHFIRHGEVNNPEKILYGLQPGWHLSDRGRQMAQVVAKWSESLNLGAIFSSQLERAQETVAPIISLHNLPLNTNKDLIEASNIFEGKKFELGSGVIPIQNHGAIYITLGSHRGASRMTNKSTACSLQSSPPIKQLTAKMQFVFHTSCRFGFCAAQLRIAVYYMIRANESAHSHPSPAFTLMTKDLFQG